MERMKIILLGYQGVGKTKLIDSIINKEFSNDYSPTLTASYVVKQIEIDNKEYELNIWDTSGYEKFKKLTGLFLKDSQIIILVYDITNRESFKELEYWINEVYDRIGDKCSIGIIGNKMDLYMEEQVPEDEAMNFAKSKGYYYTALSAK